LKRNFIEGKNKILVLELINPAPRVSKTNAYNYIHIYLWKQVDILGQNYNQSVITRDQFIDQCTCVHSIILFSVNVYTALHLYVLLFAIALYLIKISENKALLTP
jgi:hypothetical protein